jgi:hypothetical protein
MLRNIYSAFNFHCFVGFWGLAPSNKHGVLPQASEEGRQLRAHLAIGAVISCSLVGDIPKTTSTVHI